MNLRVRRVLCNRLCGLNVLRVCGYGARCWRRRRVNVQVHQRLRVRDLRAVCRGDHRLRANNTRSKTSSALFCTRAYRLLRQHGGRAERRDWRQVAQV